MLFRIAVGCCALWGLAASGTDNQPGSQPAPGGAAPSDGGSPASTEGVSGLGGGGSGPGGGGGHATTSSAGHASTSDGDASGGTGGLSHHVGSCDTLAPAGTWEEILFGARAAGYWSTTPDNPKKWTSLASPPFVDPNSTLNCGIKWDADHRLLYSLNSRAGFWRMVVE